MTGSGVEFGSSGGGGSGGVTQIVAGSGVSIAPVGGTGIVTVTNAGVTGETWGANPQLVGAIAYTAGTGISFAQAGQTVTITNAGVTSAVAGTAISVSSGTGAVTINNIGVTSIVAGTSISISGATGAVTINNTGVTSNVAGAGISVSGATGAVTVTNRWGAYPLTTTGDIVYADTAGTNTRLGIGATGTFLQSGATIPSWQYPSTLQAGAVGAAATLTISTDGTLKNGGVGAPPTISALNTAITSAVCQTGSNANSGVILVTFSGNAYVSLTALFHMAFTTAFTNLPAVVFQKIVAGTDVAGTFNPSIPLIPQSLTTGACDVVQNSAVTPAAGTTYHVAYWIIGS